MSRDYIIKTIEAYNATRTSFALVTELPGEPKCIVSSDILEVFFYPSEMCVSLKHDDELVAVHLGYNSVIGIVSNPKYPATRFTIHPLCNL